MKTVMVLGAPRSGTSMTAGVLNMLGVSMGNVRLPDPLNPKGYFEDREFLSLADDVLSTAMPGANGFNLPSPEALHMVRGHFNDRIRALITTRMRECSGDAWGWKATAVSLFADDCLPYVSNPYVVAVMRNPVSVADSIVRYVRHEKKRHMYDELSIIEALQVVSQYETSIYRFISRHPDVPHVFLAYERVIADPASMVRSLSSLLGIEISEQIEQQIIKFISQPRSRASDKSKNGHLIGILQRLARRPFAPGTVGGKRRRP